MKFIISHKILGCSRVGVGLGLELALGLWLRRKKRRKKRIPDFHIVNNYPSFCNMESSSINLQLRLVLTYKILAHFHFPGSCLDAL